jgi:hypothetical protein
VIQGQLWLSVGPVHGELGHDQVRPIVTGKSLEIPCHELLCPIEPAFPPERTDRAQIRRGREPAPAPDEERSRSREDGQNRQDDSDQGM